MESAADESRNHNAEKDRIIQTVYEARDTEVVSGGYVHAYVHASQSLEDRNTSESYNIKIDGVDVEDAFIETNSRYLIKYDRDPAGSLEQISFWKEPNSP